MGIDLETVHKRIDEIVKEYLFNISSLSNHNHFMAKKNVRHSRDCGFYMLTSRNQYIVDEEHFLEGCTRAYLINPIMKFLLDMANIRNDWKYGYTDGEINLSNREYELGSFIEFVFERDGRNIGCRYTRSSYRGYETAAMDKDNSYLFNKKSIPGFEQLTHVDEVWCIDWANEVCGSSESILASGMISFRKNMSAKEFFEALFTIDLYELFKEKTKKAVKQAQNIIALEAVPQLMPNNILAFKDSVIDDLSENKLASYAYMFHKARYVGKSISLTNDDLAILNDAFFEKGYRYALVGNADFAQSFITSEYLFRIIKSGLCIDYTSVVVGYLKAVEQLLYALYLSAFKGADGMNYWDSCPKWDLSSFDLAQPEYRYDPYDSRRKQKKYYHEKRIGPNAPEIGALAQFLRYNDECWNISENGKEYVYACLDDFRSFCRNHHFHKDNISHTHYKEVELIRNNTIVCLYYLVGAFKFLDEKRSAREHLQIVDCTFENLYRAIWEKRRRLYWITTPDGYKGIVYYYDVVAPNGFDASGNLSEAQLHFVKLSHMTRDNAYIDDIMHLLEGEEYVHANKMIITHDHMPIEIVPLMPPKKKK